MINKNKEIIVSIPLSTKQVHKVNEEIDNKKEFVKINKLYDENKVEELVERLVERLDHLFENFKKLCDIHEPKRFCSQGHKLKEGKCQEQMMQILDFLKTLKNLDEKRYDSLYNNREWNLFIMDYGDISLKKVK